MVITKSNPSPAGINFFAWLLPNSRIAKVYGISKPAYAAPSKALSYGHPGKSFPQYLSPCQPSPRLAHLCRLRPNLDRQSQNLYTNENFGIELEHAVYAFDATTIDLCLSLFPWAKFRHAKGRSSSIPFWIYVAASPLWSL